MLKTMLCFLVFMLIAIGNGYCQSESPKTELSTNAMSCHNLAVKQYRLGNHVEAIDLFRKAIQLDPKEAGFYYNLAVCYQAMQKFDKALDNYKEAIRINSNDARYHYAIGTCLQDMNQFDEALIHFKKARTLNGENLLYPEAIKNASHAKAYPLILRGVEEYKKGEAGAPHAIQYFQLALKVYDDPFMHYNLALALALGGKIKESEEEFKKSGLEPPPTHHPYLIIPDIPGNLAKDTP